MMPREKLISKGVEVLSNDELLAIILGSGSKFENVFDLSKRIVKENDIKYLLEMSFLDLLKIKGIKKAKACKVIASIELAKRIFNYKPEVYKANDPKKIFPYLKSQFFGKMHEELIVMYLDKNARIVNEKVISIGSYNSTDIDYLRIFKYCFIYESPAIIVAHNHPSGSLVPSLADNEITNYLIKQGNSLGIAVLDHLIITNEGYYSFLEHKKIK